MSEFHYNLSTLVNLNQWDQLGQINESAIGNKESEIVTEIFEEIEGFENFERPSEKNIDGLAKSIVTWIKKNSNQINIDDIENIGKINKIFGKEVMSSEFKKELILDSIKKDPYSFGNNVDKFLKACDKEKIPELAKALIEKDPEMFADDVDKFLKACDKEKIPELAKALIEKSPYYFADDVDKFLKACDKEKIPELAKALIEKSPYYFGKNVDKFLKACDKEKIPELAKALIEKDPEMFADDVDKFLKACDKEKIPELAKALIEKKPYYFVNDVDKFLKACDKEKIPELAKSLIEKDPYSFADDVDKFLKACDKEKIPELAKALIEKSPYYFGNNVDKFLKACDKEKIPELAKALIEKKPYYFVNDVDKFLKACDKEKIPELAKALIEKDPYYFVNDVDKFVEAGLDKKDLPELAKALIEKSPYYFGNNVDKFLKAYDKEKIPELAKTVIEKDPEMFADNVDKFVEAGLDKKDLPELAKIVVEKKPDSFADNVDKFVEAGLDKKDLPELAKTVIEKDPEMFADNVDKFVEAGLDKKDLPELAKVVLEKAPSSFSSINWDRSDFFEKYHIQNKEKFGERFDIIFTMIDIESSMIKGDQEDALAMILSLEDLPDYLEQLTLIIKYFPRTTGLLIREKRNEVQKIIEEKGLENFSKETKLSLLPLLSPDEIKQTISELGQGELEALLGEPIQYQEFSDRTIDVLKDVSQRNLQDNQEGNIENLEVPMRELLDKTSLQVLSAFTLKEPASALSYKRFYNELEEVVVIPLLPVTDWITFIKEKEANNHPNYLKLATKELQEAYIKEDLLTLEGLVAWEQKKGAKLEELEKEWSTTKTAIAIFKYTLGGLERLSLSEEMNEYISKKREYLKNLEIELNNKSREIEALKSEEEEEIPEEFIDFITKDLMENPYSDSSGNNLDLSTWQKCKEEGNENPFNRQPLVLENLKENKELKEKIRAFNDKAKKKED